ncbi:MAG: ABC transporter permease subunit [Nitrospinota bacterium]|nr:ABC transporter permease subunit [Nitrospinota bacterium]MDH5677691.1 ABC transporter permease subunit [Nitrospinota bacterium]MDH5755227.1 ABC transporter permease subunit [Nitrospinota bacterium]
MRTVYTMVKRELRAYFHSSIAYAIIFMFLFISGYFFFAGMNAYGLASFEMSKMAQRVGPRELTIAGFVVAPLLGNMSVVLLMMAPLLTMRLFSEEKKNGSIELLFTWPVTDFQMVMGKYLASLAVVAIMLGLTLPYVGFIWLHTTPPWSHILSGYMGLFMLAASFLSLGLFFSTLTENQIVSAVLSFGALLIFWVMGWTAGGNTDWLSELIKYFSILEHFQNPSRGVLDTRDVVYYFSFIVFFLFLSLRALEAEKIGG